MSACHWDSCESEKCPTKILALWGEEGSVGSWGESWRRFVTWLGRQTDLSFRLHGGLLRGWGVHYSSLILSEKSEANWKARAKWDVLRRCWEDVVASGCKKEKDVCLMRDLRTIKWRWRWDNPRFRRSGPATRINRSNYLWALKFLESTDLKVCVHSTTRKMETRK